MDFNLDKLRDYVDIYQITSVANRVKNAIYNYTYYEIKVREATSDEKWGASSTLLQEIALATHKSIHFDEIMNTVYYRLENKKSQKWRQIHKTLQLIEYMIKCGSERVIDSLRDHINLIKPLVHFSYVDSSGKDFGLIVRKRSNIVVKLLESTTDIRLERKKFAETRNKFIGVSCTDLEPSQNGLGFSSKGNFSISESGSKYKDDENYLQKSATDKPELRTKVRSEYNMNTHANSGSGNLFSGALKPQPPSDSVGNLIDFDDDDQGSDNQEGNKKKDEEDKDAESWGEFVGSDREQPQVNESSGEVKGKHYKNPESNSFSDNLFSNDLEEDQVAGYSSAYDNLDNLSNHLSGSLSIRNNAGLETLNDKDPFSSVFSRESKIFTTNDKGTSVGKSEEAQEDVVDNNPWGE